MATGETVQARLVADFTSEIGSLKKSLAVGFGPTGEILVAVRMSDEPPVVEQGVGTFPKSQLDETSEYQILIKREGQPVERLRIGGERTPCSYVQLVPDGVLLVGARCRWSESGPEQNGVVFDRSGKVVRRFTLGDGINDVRADSKGSIWVSYFDEGVFGNYGWGASDRAPIGASGLEKFDQFGRHVASFDPEAAGTDAICDAYAINLAGDDDVWVYFYTEFPIVRVRGGQYRRWIYGEGGARALAVEGDRVALFGSYESSSLLRRVALTSDGTTRRIGDLTVALEDHSPGRGTLVSGIGSTLYFAEDRRVFALTDW